jgi:hypothetical protein
MMKFSVKNILRLLLIGFCVYVASGYFFDRQFSVNAITFPEIKPNRIALSPEEYARLKAYFDEPFTYLDKGHQSFVFISGDGKTVLKFFDAKSLKGFSVFPFTTSKSVERSLRRLKTLLDGYQLAYEKDLKNSGLDYVQLAPNPNVNITATLYDRFGFSHSLELGNVLFAIQNAATTTRAVLREQLNADDVIGAKASLDKIVDMYMDEYQNGIYDRDHNFIDNTGFIDGRPIRIDSGRLQYDETMKNPDVYRKDLQNVIIKRSARFLGKYYPEYQSEVLSYLEAKISPQ